MLKSLVFHTPHARRHVCENDEKSPASPAGGPPSAGFTLIETILTIALIAILIGLALPSLSHVRESAGVLNSLANLRSHAQVMSTYTTDYDGTFPFLTDPNASYTVFRYPYEPSYVSEIVFFGAYSRWHWPLLETYYGGNVEIFDSPHDEDQHQAYGDYFYSASFLAHPTFWNRETRTGPEQWRPTQASAVTWPSQKAIVFDYLSRSYDPSIHDDDWIDSDEMHRLNLRLREIAFVDGHVAVHSQREITRPYFRGEGEWEGSFFALGRPLMHTIDGVRGRDVK